MNEKLYELCKCYWDLERKNYDIETNYPELVTYIYNQEYVVEVVDSIIERCQEILEQEKPRPDPFVEDVFEQGIAPVPNNSVFNVVVKAILAGGEDFTAKSKGWSRVRGNWVVRQNFEKAGKIEVSIKGVEDQAEFIESLNLFTLDVLVMLAAHISDEWSRNKTEHPLSLSTIVTASKLIGYKKVKKRWVLRERIAQEVEKLACLNVSVKNSQFMDNFDGTLFRVEPHKRAFNPETNYYITSAWEIKSGQWASFLMSKNANKFIGKLSQDVVSLDHRAQRSKESFAKKIMYSFFVLNGGTYYIKNGVKKSLKDILELIGEFRVGERLEYQQTTRSLRRLGEALDYLVESEVIKVTNIQGSVLEFIESQLGPWKVRDVLKSKIEFHMLKQMGST